MKVQIKDLKPNPFRDMSNYPIDDTKVQSLINSINQTGFWDNILARQQNGEIQIAYGHHRLIALCKIFKPDDYVDIPVKELDDATMIRVMANENDESWGTNPKIDRETVGTTREFLLRNPEEIKTKNPKYKENYIYSPLAFQIVEFLDGNWTESRVYATFERLGLTKVSKEMKVDKDAAELFDSIGQTETFTRAVKKVKNLTPIQQRRAAKRIIEKQSFGETAVKAELLDEKYPEPEKKRKEIELEDILLKCSSSMRKVNNDLMGFIEILPDIDFEFYKNKIEYAEFVNEFKKLFNNIKEIKEIVK